MKFFPKKSLAIIIAAAAMIAVLVTVIYQPKASVASGAPNVTGWAQSDMANKGDEDWTTGIKCPPAPSLQNPNPPAGWQNCGHGFGAISLNSANVGSGGGTYGVNLDPATGDFSGRAWSEWGGWVDFAPTGPFPDSDTASYHGARVEPAGCLQTTDTCKITGWIRFSSGTSLNTESTGGWDGWVKMSGVSANGRSYGVGLLAPDGFGNRTFDSGAAWGDRVVGWVKFNAVVNLTHTLCEPPLIEDPSHLGQQPPVCVCPVTLVPPVNGVCPSVPICNDSTAQNYIPPAQRDPSITYVTDNTLCSYPPGHDYCPDTKFQVLPYTDPRNEEFDPKTVGEQSTSADIPTGYKVNGSLCGIWGCTVNGYPQYNPKATIDDGTCQKACSPTDPTYNSHFGYCSPCNDKTPGYNAATGLCPKKPKNPIYIECGSGSCATNQTPPIIQQSVQ